MKPLGWFRIGRSEFPECPECLKRMQDPLTLSACASVGIEKGKSTHTVMRGFLTDFHANGHRGAG